MARIFDSPDLFGVITIAHMPANKFITIGSKGVSIPSVSEIRAPLSIGRNTLRWANPGRVAAAAEAHAWVSKNGESFEIYPLDQAVEEGRVQRVSGTAWTVKGRRYTGDAFLPAKWRKGDPIPMYVGVLGDRWPYGRVEARLINDGRNREVVGTLELPDKQPTKRAKAPRKGWTREELLIALNVYYKLSFGQLHARNPVIIDVARKLERPPGSLAMKLCNLASLDPALRMRGIRGLTGASELDRAVWDEFQADTNSLAPQSEEAFRRLFVRDDTAEVEVVKTEGVRVRRRVSLEAPDGPTEQLAQTKVRRGQQYFRQMILNAFDGRCCITGIGVRELLVASHILPWGKFPAERLNPQNGLCLSRLHDAAFDRGLISFDEENRLLLSRFLKRQFPQPALEQNFLVYEGRCFTIPSESISGLNPTLPKVQQHRFAG